MNLKSKNNRTLRIRKFHALLSQLNLRHQKANILSGYGVESTKDLTYEQLEELIKGLEKKAKKADTPKHIRHWRSINLNLLTKLGVYVYNGSWDNVNRYLEQPRIAGKLLFQMDEQELKNLSFKLRVILKKRNEQAALNDHFAKNN